MKRGERVVGRCDPPQDGSSVSGVFGELPRQGDHHIRAGIADERPIPKHDVVRDVSGSDKKPPTRMRTGQVPIGGCEQITHGGERTPSLVVSGQERQDVTERIGGDIDG
ncbi:hypothetical protein GCM10009550_71610 [Actinocorallia libanotica]|uniref:Uncharacterized protein n=1 Tax=Actinocorallia libanotica TaxID=46162 RepID=A0ABP4CHG9_9ACTN